MNDGQYVCALCAYFSRDQPEITDKNSGTA